MSQSNGSWRARYEMERGRRSTPTAEAKLARWGEVEGQGGLFEQDAEDAEDDEGR